MALPKSCGEMVKFKTSQLQTKIRLTIKLLLKKSLCIMNMLVGKLSFVTNLISDRLVDWMIVWLKMCDCLVTCLFKTVLNNDFHHSILVSCII